MKVYKLSHCIKLLAWLLIALIGLKLVLLFTETATSPLTREQSARIVVADPAYRKAAHASNTQHIKYTPENETLLLLQLLAANAANNWSLNDQCAPYPRAQDLHIEQLYYQRTLGGNLSYYLFAAYYDRRPAVEQTPSIAILAMVSSIRGPFAPAHCQVWYEASDQPDIVPMQYQSVAWYEPWGALDGHLYPVLLQCPLKGSPRSARVPQLVSLVFGDRCARATNALRVVYEAPRRKRAARFAVCVKDLKFPQADMSQRWVEWLELLRLLGAERVTAYDLGGETLQPATRRTLQHYVLDDGLLQLRPHRLLHGQPKRPLYGGLNQHLNEVLCYMDCFYRNMYEFDYVGIFDVDEVIMPLGELHNWTQLLEQLERNSTHPRDPYWDVNCRARASYCFRNIYYPKDWPLDERVPSSFYMLQHVHRVAEHSDSNSAVKCLHSTHFVTMVHNHFPSGWRNACGPYDVPVELGQLQHYREPDNKTDKSTVRDDNIWRFKDQLMLHVLAKHRELGWS